MGVWCTHRMLMQSHGEASIEIKEVICNESIGTLGKVKPVRCKVQRCAMAARGAGRGAAA